MFIQEKTTNTFYTSSGKGQRETLAKENGQVKGVSGNWRSDLSSTQRFLILFWSSLENLSAQKYNCCFGRLASHWIRFGTTTKLWNSEEEKRFPVSGEGACPKLSMCFLEASPLVDDVFLLLLTVVSCFGMSQCEFCCFFFFFSLIFYFIYLWKRTLRLAKGGKLPKFKCLDKDSKMAAESFAAIIVTSYFLMFSVALFVFSFSLSLESFRWMLQVEIWGLRPQ